MNSNSEVDADKVDRYGAVTLYTREDGRKSMKFGEHNDLAYLSDDNELMKDSAEVVEFEDTFTEDQLRDWELEDWPEKVQKHFEVGEFGGDR